jgi:hypothetical protein
MSDDDYYSMSEIDSAMEKGPAVGFHIREDRAAKQEELRIANLETARIAKIALFVAILSLVVSIVQLVAGWLHH